MKTALKTASILALCIFVSASIALAGPKGKGKAKGKDKSSHSREEVMVAGNHVGVNIFMGNDYYLIRQQYRGGLPPGLAKRNGDLPPGLQKQLRRNGHLPPGLEKKLYPFPVELERRLPPLRAGLMRGIIGGSAVIVDKNTSVILDVFAIF